MTCYNATSTRQCSNHSHIVTYNSKNLIGYDLADVSDCCSKTYQDSAPAATFNTDDWFDSIMNWLSMLSTGSGWE